AGAQLLRRQRARCGAQPTDRDPLDLRPIDETTAPSRLLGVSSGDGRCGTQRGADEEPGLPDAVVAPTRSIVPSARPVAHRAGTASSTFVTSRNSSPNSRPARAWNVSGSPVVSWTWLGRRGAVTGVPSGPEPCAPSTSSSVTAARPFTSSNSASADAVAV